LSATSAPPLTTRTSVDNSARGVLFKRSASQMASKISNAAHNAAAAGKM